MCTFQSYIPILKVCMFVVVVVVAYFSTNLVMLILKMTILKCVDTFINFCVYNTYHKLPQLLIYFELTPGYVIYKSTFQSHILMS